MVDVVKIIRAFFMIKVAGLVKRMIEIGGDEDRGKLEEEEKEKE